MFYPVLMFALSGGKGQGSMEGGIRVPGIVRWPGVIPEGLTVDHPTSQMDLLPTLAHIIGGHVPQDRDIDGRNIFPLLKGDVHHSPHNILVHYCGTLIHGARLVSARGKTEFFPYFVSSHALRGNRRD